MENAEEPIYPDPMRGAEPSYINQTPNDLPTGLSKREYFAALSMHAMLYSSAGTVYVNKGDTVESTIAKYAIAYADELLKQLKNKK